MLRPHTRTIVCSPGIGTAMLSLALAAGAVPLAAQQRVEVNARRPSRIDSADGAQRQQLRKLQSRADSLSRLYNEDDALSLEERRRIGDELDRTVDDLTRVSMHLMGMEEGFVRVRLAPMATDRAAAAMSRALTQSAPRAKLPPRGWMGIVVTGAAREPWVENGELIVRYVTHPEIVSVEPSSPAERAGLVPSDTLVSYDGVDVREHDISLTRLLKPNARVIVRVRRDGRVRDVPVTIADAPSRIMIRREDVGGTPTSPGGVLAEAPLFPLPPAAQVRAQSPVRRVYPRSPAPPTPPAMPLLPGMRAPFALGFPINGVAGAMLQSVTEGLARTIGLKQGVLVLQAPAGSPAAESGLADGDVIVKVAGQDVRTVTQLRELVGAAVDRGERSVELQTVREKQPRTIVLRW